MDAAHLSKNAARQQGWQLLSCSFSALPRSRFLWFTGTLGPGPPATWFLLSA